MEQKDIDRLLICRAAVDKQREFNRARVEAYTTCKSVTEAKTLIESKTGVATTITADSAVKTADSAVKTADSIKSTLEEERTKMTLSMYEVLRQQGFESYGAFAEWNDKMCFEVYCECYPLLGWCDLCGEDGPKNQPCIQLYQFSACANHKIDETRKPQYLEGFKRLCEGFLSEIKGRMYPVSPCIKGHGYYHDTENFQEPFIDLAWRA